MRDTETPNASPFAEWTTSGQANENHRHDVIGQPFSQDGIEWQLWLETYRARYPYQHTVVRFLAEPTNRGRRSAAYCAERARLHDDWVRDLTDSESLIAALQSADFRDEQIEAILETAHAERMS